MTAHVAQWKHSEVDELALLLTSKKIIGIVILFLSGILVTVTIQSTENQINDKDDKLKKLNKL